MQPIFPLSSLGALQELNLLSIFFRFTLATICGSFIGFERGKSRHAAGLRTHIVVCIGATSAMLVNQYIVAYMNHASDPARMGAQVVSGIGFLGAGTIMVTGHGQRMVKGLTTAAGLWASACMGLLIGVGFYEGALIMCAFLFVVIVILNRIDARYLKAASALRIYLEYSKSAPFSAIVTALRDNGWHLTHIEYLDQLSGGDLGVLLEMECTDRNLDKHCLIEQMRSVSGVRFVEDV